MKGWGEIMWFNLYLISTLISCTINTSKSMYIKRKMEYNQDEVIKKYNKLSNKEKILSNLKNIFISLCPIVNIIHSIKNLKTSNDKLYYKWKSNTLNSYIYLDRKLDEEPAVSSELPKIKVQKEQTAPELPKIKDKAPAPELPKRKENDEYVIKPEKKVATAQSNPKMSPLDYLRSEYNKEKRIYDTMVSNGASKSELNAQALKINAIVSKYKEVKNKNVSKSSGPKLTLK